MILKKNMGFIDKTIRISIAGLLIVLYLANIISGTLAIALLVVAGTFILTSVISFCPLYSLLKIKTTKEEAP
ncbi:MAG: DUF2892 domain-containing protein [Flammeovirgaceae bacterium]|nr:DUF2892 domain-containing protein [Flammeovirgaceae bacterium]